MCATQFLKSSVPSCLRVLRVNRPEARDRPTAPRAEGGAGTLRAEGVYGALHAVGVHGRNKLRPSRCRMALDGRREGRNNDGQREGRNLLRPWRGGAGLDVAGRSRGLRPVNTERAEAREHGDVFEVGLCIASSDTSSTDVDNGTCLDYTGVWPSEFEQSVGI